jgi:hypothetical protein
LIVNIDLERKCLWGLEDKGWELRHAAYIKFKAPLQPQPLPPFEGMSPSEWTELVADYSFGWLISYTGHLSSSFSLEERFGSVTWFASLLDVYTSSYSNLKFAIYR